MKIISVATMRALDERTIAAGVPGDVLMWRAGEGAYRELLDFVAQRLAPRHCRRFTVLAGKGNNGGDAYVVAKCLADSGRWPVSVYSVCPIEQLRGDALHYARQLPESVPLSTCSELPPDALAPGTVIVDGLLGTGIAGALRSPYDRLVAQVNGSGLPVVALDIPSGLNGDTGAAPGGAITADCTITMALPKAGLVSPAGRVYCGALRCVDIGIATQDVADAPGLGEALFAGDVAPILGRRRLDGHKNAFGHTLVLGGSCLYAGAPLLAAAAALRVGSGLSTVALPASARAQAPVPLNALIVRAVSDAGAGHFAPASVPDVEPLLAGATALVLGPGVGRAPETLAVLETALQTDLPVVVDADALHLLAGHESLIGRPAPTVLTPHPGEMRVLLAGYGLAQYISASRVECAAALAERLGLTVVLKGLGTVIARADGQWAVNTSGNQGLATAGSGDVLAGMLGGLLAQGVDCWDAVRLGVFAHGLAAELSACGERALAADDVVDLVGSAFKRLSPFA